MDPWQFQGTPEEYEELLREEVASGKMHANTAMQKLVQYRRIAAQRADYSQQAQERFDERYADTSILSKPIQLSSFDLRGATDEELANLKNEAAAGEIAERERIRNLSFIESLGDAGALERMGRTALNAPSRAINAVTMGLPGLIGSGVDYVAGTDTGADDLLEEFATRNNDINAAGAVSDPVSPQESFIESLTGAVVPGGLGAKIAGIGGDFFMDQAIRELSDKPKEKYETIFDKAGITNNQQEPVFSPLLATFAAITGGTLTAGAIGRLIDTPTNLELRPIRDIDPNGPENLMTAERARDLTKALVVDEQTALTQILERHGLANFDEITDRIEFDTHASQRTRVQEAIRSGRMSFRGNDFNPGVAPMVLYEAYRALPPTTRNAVAEYINLRDMADDIRIAIRNNQGGYTVGDLRAVRQRYTAIARTFPEAQEFSQRYNLITRELRHFNEGSLFSPQRVTELDRDRANYVPLEISGVDPSAPFLQRIAQAQTKGTGAVNDEWFLQQRNTGVYPLDRRQDPFDMLLQGVEASISARMRNDTKLAVVDSLLSSPTGQQTIRRADPGEVGQFPDRVVQVWRNGERENYITSKLQANLLRFDPYVSQYPWAFIPKRVFEQTVTGPLSVTFAPITFLRDAIGGRVTRAEGTRAGNLFDAVAAVPEQLWAQTQRAIADTLEQSFVKGSTPLPTWIMPAAQQRQYADRIAAAYRTTLYHMANEAGGFDASLMKSRIDLARNTMGEIERTARELIPDQIPGVGFAQRRIANMAAGFKHIFNAVQDAPRFAAIKKGVADGQSVEEATRNARQLTGDVTKSGRVYNENGRMIFADAVDQGLLNVANKGIGGLAGFAREATPFFNPMIQGTRRLRNAIVEDPFGFNLRAWTNIGIPGLAAFGWNEMLGKEYNDYAQAQQSSYNRVMNLYIGIPGKPPEEGIEIPLMHELLMWHAPFSTALYGLVRGEKEDQTRMALSLVAEEILSNSLEISFPTIGADIYNLSGAEAPEGFIQGLGTRIIREDDLGVMPSNLEKLARTQFGNIGELSVNLTNALSGDMSWETFGETVRQNFFNKAPIIKNLSGSKRSQTSFSLPDSVRYKKHEAAEDAANIWQEHFNAKRFVEEDRENDPMLVRRPSTQNWTEFDEDVPGATADDIPQVLIGPIPGGTPLNPLIKLFGEEIHQTINTKVANMSPLEKRRNSYRTMVQWLKSYDNGDNKALSEWQARLNGLVPETEDTTALKKMIQELSIDLTKYADRTRLINHIEQRRADVIRNEIGVLERLEDAISQRLQDAGFDEKFKLQKHLDPHDPDPLGIGPDNYGVFAQ